MLVGRVQCLVQRPAAVALRCLASAAGPSGRAAAKAPASPRRRGAKAAVGGAPAAAAASAPAPSAPTRRARQPRRAAVAPSAAVVVEAVDVDVDAPPPPPPPPLPAWRASVQFAPLAGQWAASVRTPGPAGAVMPLGLFASDEAATAAASAALAAHYAPAAAAAMGECITVWAAAAGDGGAAGGGARPVIAGLLGVVDAGGGTYEAVVALPGAGAPLSGGVHSSAAEAARAHDAVARMYLGDGACTNFEARASAAWAPEPLAGAGGASQVVSVRTGVRLSVDEVLALLNANAGVDVRPLDLAGKNDIAAFMVFATGRTPGHMRRLADSVAEAAAARAPYPGVPEVGVEDREGDWWMLVDLGDIIVNVFDAVARKAFDIEGWYSGMKLGEDPQGNHGSFEAWLEANPIPPEWIARLEADDAELVRGRRARGSVGGGYAGGLGEAGDGTRERPTRVGKRASKRAAQRSRTYGEGGAPPPPE